MRWDEMRWGGRGRGRRRRRRRIHAEEIIKRINGWCFRRNLKILFIWEKLGFKFPELSIDLLDEIAVFTLWYSCIEKCLFLRPTFRKHIAVRTTVATARRRLSRWILFRLPLPQDQSSFLSKFPLPPWILQITSRQGGSKRCCLVSSGPESMGLILVES